MPNSQRTRHANVRRGTARQTRRGGPRGLVGPSRIAADADLVDGSEAARAPGVGVHGMKPMGASMRGAFARPRQHSCFSATAGGTVEPASGSAAADLQKTDHSADGAPSRINAAWASGCRKLSVIASSATAKAAARQSSIGRWRLIAELCRQRPAGESDSLSLQSPRYFSRGSPLLRTKRWSCQSAVICRPGISSWPSSRSARNCSHGTT